MNCAETLPTLAGSLGGDTGEMVHWCLRTGIAFLILLIPQPALAGWTNIKDDGSGRVTGFWLMTDNAYENSRNNPNELRAKVTADRPQAPYQRVWISITYHVFVECNGNRANPIRQLRPLTPHFGPEYRIRCP